MACGPPPLTWDSAEAPHRTPHLNRGGLHISEELSKERTPSQQVWLVFGFCGFVSGYAEPAPLIDEEPYPNTTCCPSIILRVLRAA